ncbi:MAG: hypothetical protein HY755_00690 [Nitrospirae bacterium]|nr:hypothetical protein [Nitrospirota bacterium]
MKTDKKKETGDKTGPNVNFINICTNPSCRLRKAGCRGFEGCPGFMSR